MQAISSQAGTIFANKIKFSGKELQNKEFADGSGMEDYDFGARFFDPQVGRFFNVDPLTDNMRRWSPYSYSFDNPIRYGDADGMQPGDSIVKPTPPPPPSDEPTGWMAEQKTL